MKTFTVGDRVTWRSQAGGNWATKVGTVVEVVPPHKMPKHSIATRDHESYVVQVVPKSKSPSRPRKPVIYWPVVSSLKMVCE